MSSNSIPPALAVRHSQSAIISQLCFAIIKAMQAAYHAKNIGQLVETYLVAMAVRINDDAGREPCTIATLARFLNSPRSNVKRAADALVKHGMLKKEGTAYVGDLEFLADRADAEYFKDIVAAVLKAADDLRETGAALSWIVIVLAGAC
jgi:hypothetical protein